MNNKRWIYAGVLTLSGIAFVADRLFLDSPATAQARTAADPRKSTSAFAKTGDEKGQSPLVDPSLAWLEKLADPRAARDVFAPSPEWLLPGKQDGEGTAGAQTSQEPEPGSAQAFQDNHELQATVVMNGGGFAVVDGQCLSVGDSLEGFQLARVTAGQAEFQRGRERVTLTLPMPPETGTAQANPSTPRGDDPQPAVSDVETPSGWDLLRLLWGSSPRR